MKLTFVTSTLHAGGSERVMSLLTNTFEKRGYEVEIMSEKPDVVIAFMLEVFCVTLASLIGVNMEQWEKVIKDVVKARKV